MQPVRALQSTGKSKACFTWHYAFVKNSLKNVEESRLKHLRFNRAYTEANRHIYRAADIPKFRENTPRGVANAEYDCVLDNVEFIEDDLFIDIAKSNSVGAQNV